MRPKVFLASSTQSKPLMHQVADWLKSWGFEAMPWDSPGLFRAGEYILARLLELSEEVDAALMIFGDEDKQWYHANAQPAPRDNVLIEYGIFASRLGQRRTVICRKGNPKNAADLGGLIFVQFRNRAPNDEAKERLRQWAKDLPNLISEARNRENKRRSTEGIALPSGIDISLIVPSAQDRLVTIVTGSLREVNDIDVVVSSENTDLQPARYYDRSMSGTLRYLDAERNDSDLRVMRDAYVQSLEAARQKDNLQLPVLAGAVLPVATTGLLKQGIKYIFHMAVVQGEVESGYRANEGAIRLGIQNCFKRFRELRQSNELKSILFPVFGGGTGGLEASRIAEQMISAIQQGLERHPEVSQVVLFAHVEEHRRALRAAAAASGWKTKG